MNGVEILSSETIYTTQMWVALVGIILFIAAIICVILVVISNNDTSTMVKAICAILCWVTVLTLAIIDNNTNYFKEYSHTELKVTVDDSVSMTEFMNKYEILDQEGKIYIVKEKE